MLIIRTPSAKMEGVILSWAADTSMRGRVRSAPMMNIECAYSSKLSMNAKRNDPITAGFMIGTVTVKNVPSLEAPNVYAASSIRRSKRLNSTMKRRKEKGIVQATCAIIPVVNRPAVMPSSEEMATMPRLTASPGVTIPSRMA